MTEILTASAYRALRKEAEKKNKAEKRTRPTREKSEHTKALDYADMWFSRWFRANEADEQGAVTCVTCGRWMLWKMPDGSCHCGHYESRGHYAVRFMPENCGCQCKICNSFQEGRKELFGEAVAKKHGIEVKQKINTLAKLPNKRLSDFQLRETGKYYKEKYEALVKLKGL